MSDSYRTSDGLDGRRKRILFRCWHRGIKEVDLLLGRFADAELAGLSEAELDQLEHLMTYPDPDLFLWITGEVTPPAEADGPLFRRLVDFLHHPANLSRTRA